MKIKYMSLLFLILVLSVAVANAQTISDMGKKQGRTYHQDLYEAGCKECHDQGLRLPPSDNSCFSCHDKKELIEATEIESIKRKWRNPHNNMHYADKVPCIECHSEHKPKQPLCYSCHTFKYENFKAE